MINNILTVLTGNIVAQAIPIVASPLLTRLYSPEMFGVLAIITSMIGLFSGAASFGYGRSVVLPRSDKLSSDLLIVSLFCCFITCIVGFILIALFSDCIVNIYDMEIEEIYFYLVPVGILFSSVSESVSFIFIRWQQYKTISLINVVRSSTNVCFKVVLSFSFGSSALWLVLGNICGAAVACLIGILAVLKGRQLSFSFLRMRAVATRYIEFPKYGLPSTILNSCSQNLIIILLGLVFESQLLGFYSLANTVVRRPVSIVSQSVAGVLLQRCAKVENDKGDSFKLLLRATLGLAGVALAPLLSLLFWAPELFVWIFGEGWGPSGVYCQILTPLMFFTFINVPSNQVLISKKKLKLKMRLDALALFLNLVAILTVYLFSLQFTVALFLLVLIGVSVNIFLISSAFLCAGKGFDL